MNSYDLAGRNALVTGSTKGIGLANPNNASDVLSVLGTSVFGTGAVITTEAALPSR